MWMVSQRARYFCKYGTKTMASAGVSSLDYEQFGMFLSHVCLEVNNVKSLAIFYTRCFGMTRLGERSRGNKTVTALGFTGLASSKLYSRGTTLLELRSGCSKSPYRHSKASVYWKVGVSVPDVALACSKLVEYGVESSTPAQFRDVGFVSHLSDPDGFIIELLQHDFEANHKAVVPQMEYPLGQIATLGQVTLRVSDIDASLHFYQATLGMSLLSVQDVSVYGFTLYFLAWTDERPPGHGQDLKDVGIREWLWKRPYTTIELQHMHRSPPGRYEETHDLPGFKGLRAMTRRIGDLYQTLQDKRLKLTDLCRCEFYEANTFSVFDPDGIPVIFTECD